MVSDISVVVRAHVNVNHRARPLDPMQASGQCHDVAGLMLGHRGPVITAFATAWSRQIADHLAVVQGNCDVHGDTCMNRESVAPSNNYSKLPSCQLLPWQAPLPYHHHDLLHVPAI